MAVYTKSLRARALDPKDQSVRWERLSLQQLHPGSIIQERREEEDEDLSARRDYRRRPRSRSLSSSSRNRSRDQGRRSKSRNKSRSRSSSISSKGSPRRISRGRSSSHRRHHRRSDSPQPQPRRRSSSETRDQFDEFGRLVVCNSPAAGSGDCSRHTSRSRSRSSSRSRRSRSASQPLAPRPSRRGSRSRSKSSHKRRSHERRCRSRSRSHSRPAESPIPSVRNLSKAVPLMDFVRASHADEELIQRRRSRQGDSRNSLCRRQASEHSSRRRGDGGRNEKDDGLDWDDPVAVFNRRVAEERRMRREVCGGRFQIPVGFRARSRSPSFSSASGSSGSDSDSSGGHHGRSRKSRKRRKEQNERQNERWQERERRKEVERRIRGEALQRLLVEIKTENRIMDFKQVQAAQHQLRRLGPLESITTRVRLMSEHLNDTLGEIPAAADQ